MSPETERRLLQIACSLGVLSPITFGTMGMLRGAEWLSDGPVSPDLDSHFSYLSGLLLMIGLAIASCIPRIEAMGDRFRLLGMMVLLGGVARLLSLLTVGSPSAGHIAALGMELVVVPLLMLWQARVAARFDQSPTVRAE